MSKCSEKCEVYSRTCLRILPPGFQLEQGEEGGVQGSEELSCSGHAGGAGGQASRTSH